jgi:hypothetical protein
MRSTILVGSPWTGFGGVTDRHLIVPAHYVLAASDVMTALFQNSFDYPMISDDWYNPGQINFYWIDGSEKVLPHLGGDFLE